jgi:Fe-S cluster assembly iron-binding protein IscA
MLEVTSKAAERINEYCKAHNIGSAVRVAIVRGCRGLTLGLELDEKRENDMVVNADSIQVVMDKELLKECGATKVDYVTISSGCGCGGGNFAVTSANPLPGGDDGGCGCSGSSKSCSC